MSRRRTLITIANYAMKKYKNVLEMIPACSVGINTASVEQRAFTVLHRVGHLRQPKRSCVILEEAYAWRWAVRQVRAHCTVKVETAMWCMDQLRAYIRPEYNPGRLSDNAILELSALPTLQVQ